MTNNVLNQRLIVAAEEGDLARVDMFIRIGAENLDVAAECARVHGHAAIAEHIESLIKEKKNEY